MSAKELQQNCNEDYSFVNLLIKRGQLEHIFMVVLIVSTYIKAFNTVKDSNKTRRRSKKLLKKKCIALNWDRYSGHVLRREITINTLHFNLIVFLVSIMMCCSTEKCNNVQLNIQFSMCTPTEPMLMY